MHTYPKYLIERKFLCLTEKREWRKEDGRRRRVIYQVG